MEPIIAPAVNKAYIAVSALAQVQQALAFLQADGARTLAEQKAIVAIAAPPFQEHNRAQDYCTRLRALGCADARIDAEGNVIAVRRGAGVGPKLVVSAHLDTVFPPDCDLRITEKDGRIYAPGIGDDTRGLAELLSMLRALNDADIRTTGDIWFVATVGEEGLGDLRGSRALFRDHPDIDGFISIDGPTPSRITFTAVGSRRLRIAFHGPGGHSFGAYGRPSAVHAMGRAIAGIAELRAPEAPKTTFTVGTAHGGTSVNAIAGEAAIELDLRSVAMQPMQDLEQAARQIVAQAAAQENARWNSDAIRVSIEPIGDRPTGSQSPDAPIVQAAVLAVRAVGLKPELDHPASTDSNIPISLGIPAVTLGRGGANGETHTLNEWFDPRDAHLGPQKNLLTVLMLVGVEGVSSPLLV